MDLKKRARKSFYRDMEIVFRRSLHKETFVSISKDINNMDNMGNITGVGLSRCRVSNLYHWTRGRLRRKSHQYILTNMIDVLGSMVLDLKK